MHRLIDKSNNIDTPPVTSDEALALSRVGVEVSKKWLIDNESSLDDLESICCELQTIINFNMKSPLHRARANHLLQVLIDGD